MTGESGVFTDPFYSPGSDFIALGNDFITDLIIRDLQGEDVTRARRGVQHDHLRLFDAFIRLYDGQYPLMGNAQVMTAKVAWDNAAYWSVTALLFFQRRFRELEFMASIDPLLRRFFVLHARMQQLFRAWDLADRGAYADAFANVMRVDELRALQAALDGPLLDDDSLRERLTANFAILEQLARSLQDLASEAARLEPVLHPAMATGETLNIDALRLQPHAAAIHA